MAMAAQIEGGLVYGISAALYGKVTVQDGQIEQTSFHDYPVLRMNEMPEIEVIIVIKPLAITPAIPPCAGRPRRRRGPAAGGSEANP